jgi:hypothetical protein
MKGPKVGTLPPVRPGSTSRSIPLHSTESASAAVFNVAQTASRAIGRLHRLDNLHCLDANCRRHAMERAQSARPLYRYRQSPFACLPEVVNALGAIVPVFLDSGMRRGTDLCKSLVDCETGVGISRPQGLGGLAAFGQVGVEAVLEFLNREPTLIMRQAGTRRSLQSTPTTSRCGWRTERSIAFTSARLGSQPIRVPDDARPDDFHDASRRATWNQHLKLEPRNRATHTRTFRDRSQALARSRAIPRELPLGARHCLSS